MIAEDSIPSGPIVVVGTVVVGTVVVVVVVGAVVGIVVVVVVVVVVDEPAAKLLGKIDTTRLSASATVPANARGGDSPRLFFTLPPRTRRCVGLDRIDHCVLRQVAFVVFANLWGILERK
jgi:hypothetical protein